MPSDPSSSTSARRFVALPSFPGVSRASPPAAYRVVVEALTNVRRHATTASRVEVTIRRTGIPNGAALGAGASGPAGPALAVTVTNDGRTDRASDAVPGVRALHSSDRRGGLGLPGLTERVRMLGGTLTAGPRDPSSWRVAVVLPLAPAAAPAPRA